jgi:hypothetical protein
MAVSAQCHAPAALCPGERTPGTHSTGGRVGLRAGLDTETRGKVLCPCRVSNPDCPVVQSVVTHYTDWACEYLCIGDLNYDSAHGLRRYWSGLDRRSRFELVCKPKRRTNILIHLPVLRDIILMDHMTISWELDKIDVTWFDRWIWLWTCRTSEFQ